MSRITAVIALVVSHQHSSPCLPAFAQLRCNTVRYIIPQQQALMGTVKTHEGNNDDNEPGHGVAAQVRRMSGTVVLPASNLVFEYLKANPSAAPLSRITTLIWKRDTWGYVLPDLRALASLQTLKLESYEITKLPGLSTLTALQTLDLTGCRTITVLTGLSALTSLRKLILRYCSKLSVLPDLSAITSLQTLDLYKCYTLSVLPDLSALTSLQILNVAWCTKLTVLPGVSKLISLQELDVFDCSSLTAFPDLSALTALRGVWAWGNSTSIKNSARTFKRPGLKIVTERLNSCSTS
jgi:Leucine-rich repeat (LRR) protein